MLKFTKRFAGSYTTTRFDGQVINIQKTDCNQWAVRYQGDSEGDNTVYHNTLREAKASECSLAHSLQEQDAAQDASQDDNSAGTVTVSNKVATLNLEAPTALSGWFMLALAVSHKHTSVNRVVINHNGFKAHYEVTGDSVEYIPPYSSRHPHKCGNKGWS